VDIGVSVVKLFQIGVAGEPLAVVATPKAVLGEPHIVVLDYDGMPAIAVTGRAVENNPFVGAGLCG
jgi:hypothetical protein